MHVDDEKLRCRPRDEVLDFFGAEPTDIWSGDWSSMRRPGSRPPPPRPAAAGARLARCQIL